MTARRPPNQKARRKFRRRVILGSTVVCALGTVAAFSWTGLFSADSTADYFGELPSRVVVGLAFGGLGGFLGSRAVLALHEAMTASTTVHPSRTVVLDRPFEDAFQACQTAALALPAQLEVVDARNGTVRAKVPASWKSRGERLSFRVAPTVDPAQTQVTVFSRPAHRLTMADYGKNEDNVERAVSLLLRGAET